MLLGKVNMRLAVFTMFRNESPILKCFLDQLDEFFDDIFLIDHESTDDSIEIVKNYQFKGKMKLFSLKAVGYPQSQLATFFTTKIFEECGSDWLFFLDCDEFLQFNSRNDLQLALQSKADADCLLQHWANAVPEKLDGSNIFDQKMQKLDGLSNYCKVIVSKKMTTKLKHFKIFQGYHGVDTNGGAIEIDDLSDAGLIHLPIQSKIRFACKIRNSAQRAMNDSTSSTHGHGFHWIGYHRQIETKGIDGFDFLNAGLCYPDAPGPSINVSKALEFKFPYVKSRYVEDQSKNFLQLYQSADFGNSKSTSFAVYDEKGIIVSETAVSMPESSSERNLIEGDSVDLMKPDHYSDLIEPLFSLPLKMPPTAWSGHIPFLFQIFRLVRPKSYVELGVHYGASLIAAGTASKAFQIPMRIFGVDSWEGDAHAGVYSGESIFNDLKLYVEKNFYNVELMRCYFADGVHNFKNGSIDILHIDGLHTYDAVKQDFLTWLPKMSGSGIVLFHDTCVHERGFGVYRLWRELEEQFTTLQFFHSHGLGVLFLNPDLASLSPLMSVIRNSDLRSVYTSLVSDIAGLLPMRMQAIEDERTHLQRNAELHDLRSERDLLMYENLALRSQRAASRLKISSGIFSRFFQ